MAELYHPGYIAKHLECGAVVAAAPAENVRRARFNHFRNSGVPEQPLELPLLRGVALLDLAGPGGVSVAIGELADGLEIDLDAVRKKYDGLDGTELAISESQERMAVVVAPEDEEQFIALAGTENLEAYRAAVVTESPRMVMKWR